MIELLKEIQARLEAVLDSQFFEDPAGELSVPMVRIGGLNFKRSGGENREDFPFVVVRPVSGSASPRDDRVTVQVIGGVWTAADVLAGFESLVRLADLLQQILLNRGWGRYRLLLPAPWRMGDGDGLHPHPYYYVSISLTFVKTGDCQ